MPPTRAIKPRREDDHLSGNWQGLRERAPSLVRAEQPTTARVLALIALFPLTLGAAALFFALIGKGYLISPSWGVLLLVVGVAGLLYHAFVEKDLQYRRLYWVGGLVLLALGALFRLLPSEEGIGVRTFLPYGAPSLLLGLGFLGASARNETDPVYRNMTLSGVGIAGTLLALVGLIGGLLSEEFLVGQGVVMLLLGLFYLAVYIGMQPAGSDRAYWTGLGVGGLGGLMVLIALGWSLVPALLGSPSGGSFFMPRGLLLLYLGIEYLLLAVGVCSDNKTVALTRRELAAFFYSPVAYVVFIAVAVIGWFVFAQFVGALLEGQRMAREPIVARFTTGWFQVFSVVFIVPLLTMRLLSEERRTGTLEVLLTAPVNETSVVLAKFFASLRVFVLAWYPWGLFLVALRVEGGEPFDYRPLLTFFVTLLVMATGWLAMGLFFSSLTRNQIAAAIITLVAMLALTIIFFVKETMADTNPLTHILTYISYIELWINSTTGTLSPRVLVYHLSFAVFFLFLTVKVLEARKWA